MHALAGPLSKKLCQLMLMMLGLAAPFVETLPADARDALSSLPRCRNPAS